MLSWIEKNITKVEGRELKLFQYQREYLESNSNKRLCKGDRWTGVSTAINLQIIYNTYNDPGCLQLVVSPFSNSSRLMVKRIVDIINSNSGLQWLIDKKRSSAELIKFKNGSVIKFHSVQNELRGLRPKHIYMVDWQHISTTRHLDLQRELLMLFGIDPINNSITITDIGNRYTGEGFTHFEFLNSGITTSPLTREVGIEYELIE